MVVNALPENFTWGVATAAYQIEGGVSEDGRGLSIWDTFSHMSGKIKNGDTGDVAADHYHRWADDVALMAELGVNAYRFSIAWPRILPNGTGAVNQAGLDFYSRLIDELLKHNITPFVTLYHWDLPQALEDSGGWPDRRIVDAFTNYADIVTRNLGDRVKHWITLNEPNVFCFSGYFKGRHAPGRTNLKDALQATHHALLAHGSTVGVIRANCLDAHVGITLSLGQAYPLSDSDADKLAAQRCDRYHNRWFADPVFGQGYPKDMLDWYGDLAPQIQPGDLDIISTPMDFLGVNAYCPDFVRADPELALGFHALTGNTQELAAAGYDFTDVGWPIVPDALTEMLVRIRDTYAPKSYVSISKSQIRSCFGL